MRWLRCSPKTFGQQQKHERDKRNDKVFYGKPEKKGTEKGKVKGKEMVRYTQKKSPAVTLVKQIAVKFFPLIFVIAFARNIRTFFFVSLVFFFKMRYITLVHIRREYVGR